MDKIKIQNLEVFAHHGVFPEENVLGQKFIVTAILYTDTRIAGRTDELTASIHYGEISQQIEKFLTEHTFKLLECAAESLAETLLLHTDGLRKIRLEIKKPWAPVGLPLETVSVEIERGWHTAYIALGSNMGDSRRLVAEWMQFLLFSSQSLTALRSRTISLTDASGFTRSYLHGNYWTHCTGSRLTPDERELFTGDRALWIWILSSMTISFGKMRICASRMWICTEEILC